MQSPSYKFLYNRLQEKHGVKRKADTTTLGLESCRDTLPHGTSSSESLTTTKTSSVILPPTPDPLSNGDVVLKTDSDQESSEVSKKPKIEIQETSEFSKRAKIDTDVVENVNVATAYGDVASVMVAGGSLKTSFIEKFLGISTVGMSPLMLCKATLDEMCSEKYVVGCLAVLISYR